MRFRAPSILSPPQSPLAGRKCRKSWREPGEVPQHPGRRHGQGNVPPVSPISRGGSFHCLSRNIKAEGLAEQSCPLKVAGKQRGPQHWRGGKDQSPEVACTPVSLPSDAAESPALPCYAGVRVPTQSPRLSVAARGAKPLPGALGEHFGSRPASLFLCVAGKGAHQGLRQGFTKVLLMQLRLEPPVPA